MADNLGASVGVGAFIAAGGVGLWAALAPTPRELLIRDINDDEEAEALRDTELIVGSVVVATSIIASFALRKPWPFLMAVAIVGLLAGLYEFLYRAELIGEDSE